MTLTPRIRIERLIILSRAGLATSSWLAGWLDPIEPAKTAMLTQWMLEGYLGYAWCLIPILRAFPLHVGTIGLASHILDMVIFTLLVAITQGSGSPFFSYFVFALFAAALRWQKSGILWSALAFLCMYSGIGILLELNLRLDDSGFELNRFIIRNVQLAVVALLLIFLTTFEKKIRLELAKLSEWPAFNPSINDPETFVRDTLAYAALTLETPRLLMLWEEKEEPLNHLALLEPGQFLWQTTLPTDHQPTVPSIFAEYHFLCNDVIRQPPKTLYMTPQGIEYKNTSPIDLQLIRQYQIKSVIGLALHGQAFRGHLLLLDKPAQTLDDLNLGILAAQQVVTHMDQFFLHAQQQKTAAIDERIKMARDLHDGVLQTLTGIALQVKTIGRTLESDPAATQQGLEGLQALIQTEQRNLRQFIQQLKPAAAESQTTTSLLSRLQELANTIHQQWGIVVWISPQPVYCSGTQTEDIYHLIREAIVNSARHANASHVDLAVRNSNGNLQIHIADDGGGFPFHGDYDLAELSALGQGPKTIMERVQALRGSLHIRSQSSGTTLDITLPLVSAKISNIRSQSDE